MAVKLTDKEIQKLIVEDKFLPDDYKERLKNFRPTRSGKVSKLEVKGKLGNSYKIIIHQSSRNPLQFSVILLYEFAKSTGSFRLRRYNGKHSLHTNHLENSKFINDFHIHYATERYQASGSREDTFAEKTDRFNSIWTALNCLLKDCNFILPESERNQTTLEFDNEN